VRAHDIPPDSRVITTGQCLLRRVKRDCRRGALAGFRTQARYTPGWRRRHKPTTHPPQESQRRRQAGRRASKPAKIVNSPSNPHSTTDRCSNHLCAAVPCNVSTPLPRRGAGASGRMPSGKWRASGAQAASRMQSGGRAGKRPCGSERPKSTRLRAYTHPL